ncbi:AMP-binding protein [Burkholderia sp. FERM BP-3421]|nr:AMP-binding protein [Burkholderia sp. FERM BP-3421]
MSGAGEHLDYTTLWRRARAVGQALRQRGAGPETRIGLCMERTPDLIVGMLGILEAHAAYVPLDPQLPEARLRMLREDSGLSLVLTHGPTEALVERIGPQASVLLSACEAEGAEQRDAEYSDEAMPAAGLAYVIYVGFDGPTQGRVDYAGRAAGAGAGSDRGLRYRRREPGMPVCVDRFRCVGVGDIYERAERRVPGDGGGRAGSGPSGGMAGEGSGQPRDAAAGAAAVVAGRGAAGAGHAGQRGRALQLGDRAGLGRGASADQCIRTDRGDGVRAGRSGGDGAAVGAGADRRGAARCGTVRAGRRDDAEHSGRIGEAYVGGTRLARGYLGRPGASAERFVPHPWRGARLYRTGDRVRVRPDGCLEYLGRQDEQVKIRGVRVEPGTGGDAAGVEG